MREEKACLWSRLSGQKTLFTNITRKTSFFPKPSSSSNNRSPQWWCGIKSQLASSNINQSEMAQNGGGRRKREKPNILITGTPGTGKTTTSAVLAEATSFRHINVGDLVKEKSLHDGWDEEFECYVINEDLVCDELEDLMEQGGNIVDHHGCDFFPERWFDHVVVLRTDTSVLYDRLSKRGYAGKKLSNNVECEIFQVILEEAKESYPEEIVVALTSNCIQDMDTNVATLTHWATNWNSLP